MSDFHPPEEQPPQAEDVPSTELEDVSISLESQEPATASDPTETTEETPAEVTEETPEEVAEATPEEVTEEETPEEVAEEVSAEPDTEETQTEEVPAEPEEPATIAEDEAETETADAKKEEKEEKDKSKNPLEAVGGWFQKLGGGASKSKVTPAETVEPKDEEEPAAVDGNVVMTSDVSEMPEKVEPDEAEKDAEDKTDEKPKTQVGWGLGVGALFGSKAKPAETEARVLSSEDDEPLDIHPEEIKIEEDKKAGWGLNMDRLFGRSEKKDEENPKEPALELELDEHPDEMKKEGSGWGEGFGAMFRKNKKVGVESPKKDGSKEIGGGDDENEKKKGGVRQKCSAFYRSKEGKIVMLSCVALFLMLSVVVPILVAGEGEMTTFLKNAGKVNTYLQAQMIKHPMYSGDLYPEGHVTLRFDVEGRFLASFRVSGVDQVCEKCSWMIMEGDTCQDNSKIGAVLWNHEDPSLLELNPFQFTHYQAKEGVSESAPVIYNGYNLDQNENNVIIMNDAQGQSFACGVLRQHAHPLTYPKLYANVRSLPGFAPTAEADVKVRVDFYADKAFHLGFTGTGLPPNCGIMCGIAFFTGVSCEQAVASASDLGATFFDPLKTQTDPWNAINGAYYDTDSYGTLIGRPGFYLYDGFDYDEHKNRIVLFSNHGTPVACGELRENSHHIWRQVEADLASGNLVQHGFLRTNTQEEGSTVTVDEQQKAQPVVTADVAGTIMNAGVTAVHALEQPFQKQD